MELNKEDERELREEWALSKSGNNSRSTIETLKEKNDDMLSVLKNKKKETKLAKQIETLSSYKAIYDILFKDLNTEEAKELLKAISEKLEILALRKNKHANEAQSKEDQNFILEGERMGF